MLTCSKCGKFIAHPGAAHVCESVGDAAYAAKKAPQVGPVSGAVVPESDGVGLALDSSAVISPCGQYRYWLERGPVGAPFVAWVLANPSTADASLDDPTVRKARGFTQRWGYQRFVFVNVFGFRSTDPKGLLNVRDAVGPENERYIREAVTRADMIVVAWGNAIVKPKRPQAKWTREHVIAPATVKPIMCLGYTQDRSPRHPLMLAYDTPLEEYRP